MNSSRTTPQIVHKKGKIDVKVLNVLDPAYFIVRESLSSTASREAYQFIELEKSISSYYSFIETEFLHVPEKDEVVIVSVVLGKPSINTYCRGKVNCIRDTTKGRMYSVYLLDYGKFFNVMRDKVFKITPDFLILPFQAVHFRLLGLRPLTLAPDGLEYNMSYRASDEWDVSAVEFARDTWKELSSVQIEILAQDENSELCGLMYISIDGDPECFNNVLIQKNFAYLDEELLKKLAKRNTLKEQHVTHSNKHRDPLTSPVHEPLMSPVCKSNNAVEELDCLRKELAKKLCEILPHVGERSPSSSSSSCAEDKNQLTSPSCTIQKQLSPNSHPKLLSPKDHEVKNHSVYSPFLRFSSSNSSRSSSEIADTNILQQSKLQLEGTVPTGPTHPISRLSNVKRQIFPVSSSSPEERTKDIPTSKAVTNKYAELYRAAAAKVQASQSLALNAKQRCSKTHDEFSLNDLNKLKTQDCLLSDQEKSTSRSDEEQHANSCETVLSGKLISAAEKSLDSSNQKKILNLRHNDSISVSSECVDSSQSKTHSELSIKQASANTFSDVNRTSVDAHVSSEQSQNINHKRSDSGEVVDTAAVLSNLRKLLHRRNNSPPVSNSGVNSSHLSLEKEQESKLASVSPGSLPPLGRGRCLYTSPCKASTSPDKTIQSKSPDMDTLCESSSVDKLSNSSCDRGTNINNPEPCPSKTQPKSEKILPETNVENSLDMASDEKKEVLNESQNEELSKFMEKMLENSPKTDPLFNMCVSEDSYEESDEQPNYLSKLISSKFKNSLSVGEATHIDPYFKTNLAALAEAPECCFASFKRA